MSKLKWNPLSTEQHKRDQTSISHLQAMKRFSKNRAESVINEGHVFADTRYTARRHHPVEQRVVEVQTVQLNFVKTIELQPVLCQRMHVH